MSVAFIELVEMTATLNVVVSINSTTVMQTYWTAPYDYNYQFILRPYPLEEQGSGLQKARILLKHSSGRKRSEQSVGKS